MKNNVLFTNFSSLIVQIAPLSNFDHFLKQCMKSTICPNHGCNSCIWCKKIDGDKYFDLILLDANVGIKKEEIENLIFRFSQPGLEKTNIKFYVIKNLEYASKKVTNSLLKFIEEPPKNVYGVFTTKNWNAIIPTIRSRCSYFFLSTDNKMVQKYLFDKQISTQERKIITKCFYTLEDLQKNFNLFIEFFNLIKKLSSKTRLLYVNDIILKFKKLSYDQISLFIEISKQMHPDISLSLLEIQNKLYLNPNKNLIFFSIYNLLKR